MTVIDCEKKDYKSKDFKIHSQQGRDYRTAMKCINKVFVLKQPDVHMILVLLWLSCPYAIARSALVLTLFAITLCVIVMQKWAVRLDDHLRSFTVLFKFLMLFERNKNVTVVPEVFLIAS